MTSALSALARDAIRRHQLLDGGERLLVAVSGGADSTALLDVLVGLAPEFGLAIQAAHVHHGLRPEADGDADVVRRLCERLGVPLCVERVDVRREPPWEGLEAEARRARHAALAARARALGASRIATGHTADDQAETVVMRLLAGAGPRGLAGIAPRRGALIRPLLDARREDVIEHLRRRGLGWVEDATNADPRFLRNRVRHDVLPFLGRVFGGSVTEALCRSAALTRGLVGDLDRVAAAELRRLARRGPAGFVFGVADLLARPAEVAARALELAAAELGVSTPARGAAHRAVRRLLQPAPTRRALVMGSLSIERSGAWLRVGPTRLPAIPTRRLSVPGSVELPEVGLRVGARVGPRPTRYEVPRAVARAAFDADRMPDSLVVRARRAGDRFAPFGGSGSRRLKSFLIDAGVARWERPRTPLVEAAGEIVWVAGVRRAAAAAVTAETARILEVTLDAL